MTIADNLTLLNSTKQDIKAAIEAKGVNMTGVAFTDYDTKIGEITTGGGEEVITNYTWTRNTEWLSITPPLATEQKVILLVRVNPLNDESNKTQIYMTSTAANFTIDWGDGDITTLTGVNLADVKHDYDFNDTALNGTLTTDGYKQAIITITCSNTIATFALTAAGFSGLPSNIMEAHISLPNTANITLSDTPTTTTGAYHPFLEYVNIVSWDVADYNSRFRNLINVRKITMPYQTTTTRTFYTAGAMFEFCYNLYELPDTNWQKVRPSNNFCASCSSIKTFGDKLLPMLRPASSSVMSLFSDCYSLIIGPKLSDAFMLFCTSMNSWFVYSAALEKVPDYNTSNITNMNSLFRATSIGTLPNWNTTNVTDMGYMFFDVPNIKEFTFNTTSVTSMSNMFYNSHYYADKINIISSPSKRVNTEYLMRSSKRPTFEPSDIVYSSSTFNMFAFANSSLYRVTKINLVGSAGAMFNFCNRLLEILDCDFSGANSTTNMFANTGQIRRFKSIGPAISFTIANNKLSGAALNEMYSLLPTVTGQTITVTGNPGTATDNPAIATAKGWTVVG